MSRWLVFFVFPVFLTAVRIIRGVVLFKRGAVADKEAFNAWLDATLKRSVVPGLLVYPEGHRSLRPTSLPLKRGMLHFAYGRKLPVQIIVTAGKESVMSEKALAVHFGRALVTKFSRALRPTDYPGFDAFFAAVQSTWDECWKAAYGTPAAGTPRLTIDGAHGYDYPPLMRWQLLVVTLLCILLFGGVLLASWRALAALLAAAGAARRAVVLLLALWVGASASRSFV